MFERKIYRQLYEWKQSRRGSTALLLEGQRRVGKSTLVEEFGRNEYESYVLIDFSTCSQDIRNLFRDVSDLNFFFLQLQLLTGVRLIERKSLVIFDEVQLWPLARQAIKTLVKDHRYDYIETGSLISLQKNVRNILIPSEEQRLQMTPMDFEEFLWAIGDSVTPDLLRHLQETGKPAGDAVHRKLMRLFRLYMLVGGMPQAVQAYLDANNFEDVDEIKRNILSLYEDDFRKIDSSGQLSLLFDSIPAQLGRNSPRYAVSSVLPDKRPSNSLNLIAELVDSRTVLAAYHVSQPCAAMSAFKDLSRFKLYLSDTGLFVTLMFKNKAFTENDIYQKLMSDKLGVNLGYLYENAVAQMLTASGHELFYHTFPNKQKTANYEIDFLISDRVKICPIEVKSAGYRTHASLDAFSLKFSSQIARKFILYCKDRSRDKDVDMLPIYMTKFL
jgi:hypothetical protein